MNDKILISKEKLITESLAVTLVQLAEIVRQVGAKELPVFYQGEEVARVRAAPWPYRAQLH